LGRVVYWIKNITPKPLWRAATAPYWWWYNRARHQLAALFDGRRRRSVQVLKSMKDIHQGERCFIIGNGPSLKRMDLSPLRDEFTFGMNRIYLHFEEMGFETSYFVSVNTLVIEQCAEDIENLNIPRFITWRGRRWLDDPEVIYLDTDYTDPATFSQDVTGRVFEGSTVTYVALQLAFHMGFEEVILIGVDHSFKTEGPPNVTVTSTGEDQDHFSSEYFGKGFRWQLPDLEASERAYELARQAYQAAGRRVLDATVEGALEVFPKVEYDSLFEGSRVDVT
ncbi:MAG: 6-hydroxymethylpterin diphosphokinase MptE-like protein, partial [Anaerolineales bacterium]